MKAGVTVVIIASAIAAVACTNTDTSSKQDRAAGTEVAAAPTGIANPNPAQNEAAPVVANDLGLADRTKEADNTRINERDRRDTTTPVDQGNSAAETSITASIRKGIMADESLSFNAKNVKVITVGSKVTLRGPVETDQAKAAIGQLATRTTGVSEVDNQLEVVKSRTSAK
jgi:osmotically-inducible protein OsmY